MSGKTERFPEGFTFSINGRDMVIAEVVLENSLYVVEYAERRPEDDGHNAWTMLDVTALDMLLAKGVANADHVQV